MGRARAGDRARRIHRCRRPAEKLQTASVGLCCSVKTVVHAVFTDHADRICRSPERPDLPISKEEACGHVIGSLCIGELLAEEGRKIGKRVYNVRRGCRRERALAAIERDLQTACAERLRATSAESALKLPDHRSVIVESKPVSAAAAASKAVDKLANLRVAAARAEAAVLPAEAAAAAAKRRSDRAKAAIDAVYALRFETAREWSLDEEEWQAIQARHAQAEEVKARLTAGRDTRGCRRGEAGARSCSCQGGSACRARFAAGQSQEGA